AKAQGNGVFDRQLFRAEPLLSGGRGVLANAPAPPAIDLTCDNCAGVGSARRHESGRTDALSEVEDCDRSLFPELISVPELTRAPISPTGNMAIRQLCACMLITQREGLNLRAGECTQRTGAGEGAAVRAASTMLNGPEIGFTSARNSAIERRDVTVSVA